LLLIIYSPTGSLTLCIPLRSLFMFHSTKTKGSKFVFGCWPFRLRAYIKDKITAIRWSNLESINYINWLEFKACLLAIQSFAKSHNQISCFMLSRTRLQPEIITTTFEEKIKVSKNLAEALWHWCKLW
jgi:hypothetical protein